MVMITLIIGNQVNKIKECIYNFIIMFFPKCYWKLCLIIKSLRMIIEIFLFK